MKRDPEVLRMLRERAKGRTQEQAAARAGMSVRTAGTYERLGQLPSQRKPPRRYRTRPNPFAADWPWITSQLERDAALHALAAVLSARTAGEEEAAIERVFLDMVRSPAGPALPPPLRLRAISVLARARGDEARQSKLPVAEDDASVLASLLAEPVPSAWPHRVTALPLAAGGTPCTTPSLAAGRLPWSGCAPP